MGDTSEPRKDDYFLHRGGLASARLTGQHFIITERQGWLLHPAISSHLSNRPDIKIADLATGNGIWAISMAKQYPNAEIIGLDISAKQFPAAFTWPSNVAFDVHDMFDPVPAKYENYFDLMHVRLIVAAIHDKDTALLLTNLLRMIKPGGYLEWDELAAPGPVTVDETLNVDYSERPFVQRIYRLTTLASAFKWIDRMPEALTGTGFTDVVRSSPPVKADLISYENESMVWSIQEILDTLSTTDEAGGKAEMEKAAAELQQEIDNGLLYVYNWKVIVGRKPLQGLSGTV